MEAVLKHWSALAAIAGVVTFGVVELAYEAFYRRLGTTPHEVGVDRAVVVAQAAVFLGVFVLVALVLVTLVIALMRGPRLARGAALIGLGGALGLLFFFYATWLALTMLVVLACLVTIVVLLVRSVTGGVLGYGTLVAAVGLAAVAIVVTGAASVYRGIWLAERVKDRQSIRPYRTFLVLQADPVCLRWPRGATPAAIDAAEPVAYLGRDGDHLIVFDYAAEAPVRLPAAQATIVRTETDDGRC